jgi:hypothetical protein
MTDGVASRWDFLLWGGALQIATLAVILVTLKRLGALD